MADRSNTRIKRKPAPEFPYSSRYPPPDPTDPFAPLSVLRARAHSSTTALDNVSQNASTAATDPYSTQRPGTAESRRTLYLHEQPEAQAQRPWLGLAKGYLSEAASLKPLRPPKSRKRLSEVRNNVLSTYLTDSEVSQFMGHIGTPSFQRSREPATASVVPSTPQKHEREENAHGRKHPDDPLATSTPRDRQRQATTQRNKDPQYQQRRRSQSVPVLSLEDNCETVKRSSTVVIFQQQQETTRTRPNKDEAAQYAYGDRQSHGYLYGDLEDLENNADFAVEDVISRPPHIRYHSNESTTLCGSDLEAEPEPEPEQTIRRQTTPPMTPDDTLSSMSTSPLRNRSLSPQLCLNTDPVPPETPAKPTIYVEDEDALYRDAPRTRRNVNVSQDPVDTPAMGIKSADFSILRPPPVSIPSQASASQMHSQVPPSPVRHASLAVPRNMAPPGRSRQAESDTELTIAERRRTRAAKNAGTSNSMVSEYKRPAAMPLQTLTPASPQNPSFASDVSAQSTPYPTRSAAITSQREEEEHPHERGRSMTVPKPKKSLSHVNLALKPLPNMSLATTVATSANTSMASVVGLNTPAFVNAVLRPPPPPLPPARDQQQQHAFRAQTAPVNSSTSKGVNAPRHAQTEPLRFQQRVPRHVEGGVDTPRMRPTVGKKPLSTIISHYDPSSDESSDKQEESQEDLATYSILTNFTRMLSPLETPVVQPSEVSSHYGRNEPSDVGSTTTKKMTKTKEYATQQEPEPARRAMPLPSIPARRGSDQVVPRVAVPQVEAHTQTPRTESPVPRVASPVPKSAPSTGTRPDAGSTVMSASGYARKATAISSEEASRAKSPVPQGVGMSVQEQIVALPPSAASTQQQTGRARSPVPVSGPVTGSLRSKNGPAHLKDTEDERASQRSKGSRDDSGYLPVAQLRPPMSRQGTSQSVSQSGHGKQGSNKRGGSSDSGVQMKEREREREKSPEPAGQSPPATTRVQRRIMTRHPPLKDLDSPLPPPPMQVESAPADITSFQQKHARELLSPMPLASSPTEIRSSPERARKHRTAPPTPAAAALPSPTLTTHSRPEDEYRGRSHSPTPSLRNTAHKRSQSSAQRYPPAILDGSFDEDGIPTRDQLQRAAAVCVVAQNGIRVPFGDVIRERKTMVIFIRHFWCPLCQDYMHSIVKTVNPDALKRAGVNLVVIGNGSSAMIKSYKQIFRFPFELYTDPTHKVHKALGMTLKSTHPGPDAERGEYVRHGIIGGIAMVVRNALRVGMPIWEKGGDAAQLGGEFVIGPGLTCSYAHRMKNTRAHAPIAEVLAAAGVPSYVPRGIHSHDNEDRWMERRDRSLERMQARRDKRRCNEPDWCGVEYPYDDRSQETAGGASWESRGRSREADEEVDSDDEERITRKIREAKIRARANNLKKAPRSYRVVNPDRSHPPSADFQEKYAMWHPDRRPTMSSHKSVEQDDAYMLTQEVLAYTFGGKA